MYAEDMRQSLQSEILAYLRFEKKTSISDQLAVHGYPTGTHHLCWPRVRAFTARLDLYLLLCRVHQKLVCIVHHVLYST